MKRSMYAMIHKDFRGVVSNRRLFASLLIVPIVLTVLLPSIFVIAGHFTPDDPDLQQMLSLLPESIQESSLEQLIHQMLLNYILPVFFLMIPIMTASIMAASSFVGEKEKRTLETLLYAPLTLKEIFRAKVLACFLVSMLVSLISFAAMLLVLETELFFLHRQRTVSRHQLAGHPAASVPGHLPHCHYPDCPAVRQGQNGGGIPARGGVFNHPGGSAGHRTVHRRADAQRLGAAGAGGTLRPSGRTSAETSHGQLHL